MANKAAVLLANGFEEIEAATPIDVLRRAGVEVTVVGVGSLHIRGAHDLTYTADLLIDEVNEDFDLVVLPGGMPGARNLGDSKEARALTEKALKDGKLVAAICAAPVYTLGAWGILDHRRATCYPSMEEMFPSTTKFILDRVVVDDKVTTSRGPGTALEFSLSLVLQLLGAEVAKKIAADMLVLPGDVNS